jgi:hypothetical protein
LTPAAFPVTLVLWASHGPAAQEVRTVVGEQATLKVGSGPRGTLRREAAYEFEAIDLDTALQVVEAREPVHYTERMVAEVYGLESPNRFFASVLVWGR